MLFFSKGIKPGLKARISALHWEYIMIFLKSFYCEMEWEIMWHRRSSTFTINRQPFSQSKVLSNSKSYLELLLANGNFFFFWKIFFTRGYFTKIVCLGSIILGIFCWQCNQKFDQYICFITELLWHSALTWNNTWLFSQRNEVWILRKK